MKQFSQTILLALPVTIEAIDATDANSKLSDAIADVCASNKGMRHHHSIEFTEEHLNQDDILQSININARARK